MHTHAGEQLKKLTNRSVFQQRQSCGTCAAVRFADQALSSVIEEEVLTVLETGKKTKERFGLS